MRISLPSCPLAPVIRIFISFFAFFKQKGLHRSGGPCFISQKENYTLQNFENENGAIDHIEIWGFLNNGNSFLVRSSYQSIQNNISQSLLFFSLIFLVMLIIAAVIIFFIINVIISDWTSGFYHINYSFNFIFN